MRLIWKFRLVLVAGRQLVIVPKGARILAFGMQESPVFWVEFEDQSEKETLAMQIIGTGHDVPKGWHWLATIQDEPFVWHIYGEDT